ncbi:armadillo repeat-containing protein 3 [Scleropages formosus]|uniref:Armadillo repeat containing 3 n=1 Tax=Scleropages formosus TaxID=113540 RepID=A0A8C9S194_SCLFO|nr:armadillo repeat-containing protein 3 [Scleropages formosus]
MGKKVKKEAEIPSKDVFDPISIESKKADTVVLMLNSAEEEVLTKACEAIHKYAEKGDESKGTLVSLGVLEPLSRLICHEDKLVRRNAFMALGVLACNDDVKKQLKKMDIIPSIISKLSPDEDVLIHEFATLCLASLSIEFTNKVHIFDNDGLDPLIHLLSSPDPDVQKNSAECIYNLVQDLQCRVAVCKMDGIPPLLELVHSEFPVIQQLALRTLDSITLEAEAWDAFREEQGLPRLLDFLAAKEFNDLHVEALHVLSNCLDDPSTMQLFRDAGGVNRLLQFMTAATLPEVQMSTAKVISKVAQSSEDRKLLHEHGVEKVLIHLLATDHDGLRTAVCQAVAAMSENLASRDTVRDLEGIEAVVQLLSSESGEVRMAATFALSRLTCGSQLNTHAVYEAQGNEPLLQLIQRGKAEEVVHAAAVITNMAAHERLRADILVHGGMQSFAGLLQSADPCVLAAASLAVAALACDSDGRTQFRNTGGLVSLVKLLSSNSTEVRRNACWAARVCANDELTATEMCKLGALEILQDINLSTNRRNKFSQAAFQQLLDSNLSVKYSLTGYLSCTNITKDGFYDPGQVKMGHRVLLLEEFSKQPVHQHRPVIAVNGKPHELESSELTDDKHHDSPSVIRSSSVMSKCSGKTPSKGRGKGRKEDEKQKDEDDSKSQQQEIAAVEKPFVLPYDATFHDLAIKATACVLPLRDEREQHAALATLVSEAMGGAVDRDNLHEFSWELQLSELKFEVQSNIIPIGKIKKGTFYHRALLYKTLADRIGLSCSLVRGEYNRAWNEVRLIEGPSKTPEYYILDLMHSPGLLLKSNSPEAVQYQTI